MTTVLPAGGRPPLPAKGEAGPRSARPNGPAPVPDGVDPAPAGPAVGQYGAGESGEYKVLLVSSGGGHLAQLYRLESWWSQHDRLWVTFDLPCAGLLVGERVVHAHSPTTRNLRNLIRNLGLAWRLLRAERPDVVVSTGAGVALPFFVAARLHGIRRVYLEVYDRIDSTTLTGRLCKPFSDLFLVQWDSQRAAYADGTVVGPIY